MCGINGIFGLDGLDQPKRIVEKMNKALAHRGPDADGIFLNEQLALGHRRLAIIDLDDKANQPMKSADGRYTIVYNGELYNYSNLKDRLKDYPYKTKSDTEVILAAFSKWGVAALQLFNGMFAFAIWDDWEEHLLLVRDRVGIKPVYYAQSNKSLVFSSEIRSLLVSGMVERKVDRNSLVDYLRYSTVHSPNTIIQGIKMLEPGHYLKITDVETEVRKVL